MNYVFFFNDTATTEIYTLSLHDALPISGVGQQARSHDALVEAVVLAEATGALRMFLDIPGVPEMLDDDAVRFGRLDRKSTRLNSSHANISYAAFCFKTNKPTCIECIPGP